MSEEMDILGFDPSQLSVFSTNTETKSYVNKNLYATRPADSKSDDGVYRAKIKVIYSPQNLKGSILEVQSYSMQDENGYFSANTSLMVGDKSCPIFTAWKKCRYAEPGTVLWKQAAKKEDGGKALFDKRFARYVTVQILEDKNQPDLQGKYMLWKLPSSIYDMIIKKTNPSKESGNCPVPVMDFLFGYALKLEVEPGPDDPKNPQRKTREVSYHAEFTKHPVSCTNPDGSSLLTKDEQKVLDKYIDEMEEIWDEEDVEKRNKMLAEVSQSENTKELRKIYAKVLEDIKEFCPDLNEELGFKPWDEALAKRVKNWLDIVMSGNEPKVTSDVPEDLKNEDEDSHEQASDVEESDDDLPF